MNQKIYWHRIIAKLFELLLTPLDILVQSEFPVMKDSPRGDVLLLRRKGSAWSEKQKRYLPNGIRDSTASHVIIELKVTESLTSSGLLRAAVYDDFYRASQQLAKEDVLIVLISSKQPQKKTLEQFQFAATMQSGVYQCQNVLAQRVMLISLNELDDTAHNLFIKFFASKQKSRQQAFKTLLELGLDNVSNQIVSLLAFVLQQQQQREAVKMQREMTIEEMMEQGEKWIDLMLASVPLERVIAIRPQAELVRHLDMKAVLAGLRPEDRLAGLRAEERLAGLEPEERLAGLEPEERLAGLEPEERLVGLEPEVIEAYLRKLKQEKE